MATKCKVDKNDNEPVVINTSDSNINDLANTYIQDRQINVRQSVGFVCLLNYLSAHITVDRLKTDQLVYYFNIYTELCSMCNILPDMTGYSILINIPYETVKEWKDGQARRETHYLIVKKMTNYCKNVCVSEAGKGNIGAIYISKAIHGLSDSVPAVQNTQNNLYINAPVSREKIAEQFGVNLIEAKT